MDNKIREIRVEKDGKGDVVSLIVVFGPHHYMQLSENQKESSSSN